MGTHPIFESDFDCLTAFVRGQYAPIPTDFPDTTTGDSSDISCWHCDAVNMTECDMIGAMKPCLGENQVCMIEVRKQEAELERKVEESPVPARSMVEKSSFCLSPVL